MIILGIIAIIFGGILYYNGNTINNDLDAQMESIFNDGVSNPGSDYETFGILLLVVGFALLIIGVIVSINKKGGESTPSNNEVESPDDVQTIKEQSLTCKKCGASVAPESKFCMECGEPLAKTSVICPHCGGSIPQESKYCMHCGKEKGPKKLSSTLEDWICECGNTNPPDTAFCSECGRPHTEFNKSLPWICSNCGTENAAHYIFCVNCKTTCKGNKE